MTTSDRRRRRGKGAREHKATEPRDVIDVDFRTGAVTGRRRQAPVPLPPIGAPAMLTPASRASTRRRRPSAMGGPLDPWNDVDWDVVRDAAKIPAEIIARIIEGLAGGWAKLTGFPRFVVVAGALYYVTKREITAGRKDH